MKLFVFSNYFCAVHEIFANFINQSFGFSYHNQLNIKILQKLNSHSNFIFQFQNTNNKEPATIYHSTIWSLVTYTSTRILDCLIYAKIAITKVPIIIRHSPRKAFLDSFSRNTIYENRIDTIMLNLSIGTTTDTMPF